MLSPLIIHHAGRHPKLRVGLPERLGRFSDEKQTKLRALRKSKRIIWLHGVSVGEVKAVMTLLPLLKERLRNCGFFITTTTTTGMSVLSTLAEDESVVISYFPLGDLANAVGRFLRLVEPKVFVSAEAEAWPYLLARLRKLGAKTLLVNARLYLDKKPYWKKRVYSLIYKDFDRILCQNEGALARFKSIGIPNEKLMVTGNIKHQANLERWTPAKLAEFREKLGWKRSIVITAGSTHESDERIILSAFEKIKVGNEKPVLALVPRHPERGREVLQLTREMYFKAQRYSYYNEVFRPLSVLIVDEMGTLPNFYQIADIVILGGTFDPRVGGHNIVEPVSLEKPIIVGPNVDSIASEVKILREKDALIQAGNEEELKGALLELINDEGKRIALGKSAYSALIGTEKPIDATVEEIARALES